MSLSTPPELATHALYDQALRRLRVCLQLDSATLRMLRQAAEEGAATELSSYGWALGVAPEELTKAGPMVAAQAYEQALRHANDDAAVAFGAGLANVGAFSRRRSLSPAARRGFTQAARLDPDNLLPHLAVAAVRQSTNDAAAAHHALDLAMAASRFAFYDSPVAGSLAGEAPWLAQSWIVLWPERTRTAVQFVVANEARIARHLQRRSQDVLPPLARLDRLARKMLELAPPRSPELLLAAGTALSVLTLRGQLLSEADATAAAQEFGDACLALLERKRALASGFEAAVRREIGLAGAGVAGGLVGAVVGLVRSGRRWPPPWPPLALPGRTIAWAGVAATALAAGSVTVTNPAAASYRRAVERRLLARETRLLEETAGRLRERLAALAPL